MKPTEPESLGDVLRMAIEQRDISRRLAEVNIAGKWPEIVGSHIAALTSKPSVKNGVMTIRVSSPAMKQELNMSRSRLINALNRAAGEDIITELRFIS